MKDSFSTHGCCHKTYVILGTLGDRSDFFLLDDLGVLNLEEIAMAALFAQEKSLGTIGAFTDIG